MNHTDYDNYEVLYDFDESEIESDLCSEPLSIPDAFLACRRQLHVANIGYIAELAHTTKEEVALALQGTALFQNPEFFMRNAIEWNIDDGWEFREQYLSGFLPFKLRTAKIVNRRMNGKFDKEVRALEKLTDDSGMIQTMPVFSLGAPFIPEEIYAVFIQTLLRLRDKPRVVYNPLKARFHIGITNQDDLRQAKSNPLYNTTRMNAIEIITKTMNAATVKVYDDRTDYYGKVIRIFNKTETYRAQEIQKKLIEVFKSYINSSTSRRKRVKDAYAKTFIGFHHTSFDGSYLIFPDLNPHIPLFNHQKNAIAQALESEHNVLFAHRVGAGKTYVIIITAHELYRTGLSKKNLVVVPNQILQDFEQAHKLLYPDDKILVVTPKMFTPSHRSEILEDIRDGDYTAVYMAYSSFKMVPMSKQYKLGQMSKEIGEIRAAAASAPNAYERHSLESMADKKAEKMREFAQEYSDPQWLCFDRLGVETLFVDEAHNFKNISINSRSDGIVGMRNKGSKTADEMLQKVHFVNRAVFSTGTPLTNSIADLYTLMTYLQPEQLKFRNIESFDMWINTFGERESDFELDVGHKLRPITRFSTFHNLEHLRISSRQRERQLAELNQMVDAFPDKIRRQKEHVDHIRNDYKYYTQIRAKISREERQAFGEELIEALKQKSSEPRNFDTYNGFTVELPADMPPERPYIYLVGAEGERYYVEIDPRKPMGCSQRIDLTLDRLDECAEQQNAVLSQYRRQLKDARADIAAGNKFIEQIEAFEQELERIDKELNESEAA